MNLSKFAESLTELIEESKLTPSTLADTIGCGRGTISRYLSGQKMPRIEMLVRIADFFACSVDYVLGRETEKYPRVFIPCPSFQARLPILCKELGITKYKLQKATGIAESAIYNWQRGEGTPNLENVIKIANAFDCSVDFVIGRSKV